MAEAVRSGADQPSSGRRGAEETVDLLDDFADHVVSFVDRSQLKCMTAEPRQPTAGTQSMR